MPEPPRPPSPPGPETDEMHSAAVRVRQMVGAGGLEMTAGQLLAMFDREDVQESREEIADELFTVGLVTRPSIVHSLANEKLKIITPDEAEDHLVRNGIIWSILIPIIGVIWAIRLFARERVGGGFAVLATAILVVLVYFYAFGTFDKPLSSIGLNVHECARNGLGQTFCGHELDEYRAKIERVKQELVATQEKTKREQAETEQKASEEKTQTQANERSELESKMAAEKAIVQREPEGSYAGDLARDEYESDRAQLQQLGIR